MKEVLKAFKTRVYPNGRQATKLRMNCGAARFAFNWALNKKKEAHDKGERTPSNIDLHRELNKIKGTDELPWAYEVSKCSFQNGLRDCDAAYKQFFGRCKKGANQKGFPKFKSKKNDKQSFRLDGSIHVGGGYCKLPRIGKVKLSEKPELNPADILSATVSYKAGKWYVSFQVRCKIKEHSKTNKVIGIDLGVKTLATCSDGTCFQNPKALKQCEKILKRRQKQFSRKKKGSKNRVKARLKLSKIHQRIQSIRTDNIHKVTTKLVNENQVIMLEKLNVSGMTKNHKLAKAICDASMAEFRRQITYKANWYGREVHLADTFYPSTKLCHKCGWKHNDIKLSDRTFVCQRCDNVIDRDLNAALNLKQLYRASSARIQASGDGSSFDWETGRISPPMN